ncbi:SMI1/KNR4 family protein [Labilibacter marinus]|uniref:SMI1/KNR4 family protein n=1 Tax=Labilibacter marinus TaxID=1477105 RepID=UPI00094FA31B|nr:SMI1/KNR4 family protein [Labilibacter marinus]
MRNLEGHKEFMIWFKEESEKHFCELELDKDVYGLQFQKGTKWNEGLLDEEIEKYQKELGFEFPEELKWFFKTMNGTNLPGINVFGSSGLEYDYEPIYHTFPDHLTQMKDLIDEVLKIKSISHHEMLRNSIPFIFPIERFYFMVIDNLTNPIYYISIGFENHDLNKPIVYTSLYADTLQSYLIKSILERTNHISDPEEFPERIRKSNYWTENKNR